MRISTLSKLSIIFLCFIIAGCASRARLDEYPMGDLTFIVRNMGCDNKGLPVIGQQLVERPAARGDHFTLVRTLNGQPVISYDIVVVNQKPDFAKPVHALYEWTGKGFSFALTNWYQISHMVSDYDAQNGKEAIAQVAVIFTVPVIGAAGGFVVGVVDGIRQTAEELSKIVTTGEQVVTCTVYEYDALNRLAYMHMRTPDLKQELVRTEFSYNGSDPVPVKTVVKSMVEDREREIK
jgi:hypothetical protein